ncbi:hypothetical protein DFH09DRAFT_1106753 [Mycena vulgaris]|nr:hypothetical protein DFH09DRAFT_1106753 [Mycena vulgaris]
MDAATIRRFVQSNVNWPADRFFIPYGGFEVFLHENLRFKVFLLMTAVSPDAYASHTIRVFAPGEREAVRLCVADLVRHMFYAGHIRQNKFYSSHGVIAVPGKCAWMFHVILVLLRVVGFEGEDVVLTTTKVVEERALTEGMVAKSQAAFFLSAALASYCAIMRLGVPCIFDYKDYDHHGRISWSFPNRVRPEALLPIPIANENLDESILAEVINEWRWADDTPSTREPPQWKPFNPTAPTWAGLGPEHRTTIEEETVHMAALSATFTAALHEHDKELSYSHGAGIGVGGRRYEGWESALLGEAYVGWGWCEVEREFFQGYRSNPGGLFDPVFGHGVA